MRRVIAMRRASAVVVARSALVTIRVVVTIATVVACRRGRRSSPVAVLVTIASVVARLRPRLADLFASALAAAVIATVFVAGVRPPPVVLVSLPVVLAVGSSAGDLVLGAPALVVPFRPGRWRRGDQQAEQACRRGALGAIGRAQHGACLLAHGWRGRRRPRDGATAQRLRSALFDEAPSGPIRPAG